MTNDKDFGELIYRQKKSTCGVILLRLEHNTPAGRISVLRKVLQLYKETIKNKLIVATETKIRIRKLL